MNALQNSYKICNLMLTVFSIVAIVSPVWDDRVWPLTVVQDDSVWPLTVWSL